MRGGIEEAMKTLEMLMPKFGDIYGKKYSKRNWRMWVKNLDRLFQPGGSG